MPAHDIRLAALLSSDHDAEVWRQFPDTAIGLRAVARAAWKSDVIHSHQRIAATFVNLIAPWKRRVEHVHNEFSNLRLVSFRSTCLIAVSESVAKNIRLLYPRRTPLFVVPNGVPDSGIELAGRRSEPSQLHLLAAGRLTAQKDPSKFLDLIEAFAKINPAVRGTWVGDGELRDAFLRERDIRSLTEIVSHESWMDRQALIERMGSASALVLTSAWEGLPLVALEALSMGTPVLTTECGEIADLIRSSESGLVWGDVSASAFAAQALGGLNDNWMAFSQGARRLYETRFSVEIMVERVQEVYER